MISFVTNRIMKAYNEGGLVAGRNEYSLYFVQTKIYLSQKQGVDDKLKELGRGDIIVN